jgi:hypothetical protein
MPKWKTKLSGKDGSDRRVPGVNLKQMEKL